MNHGNSIRVLLSCFGVAILSLLLDVPICVAQTTLAEHDAEITGRELQNFEDQGEQVSVILGDFHLTLGEQVISGRDAVVWLTARTTGSIRQNVIHVYVEGDAKVVEPDGTETGDHSMFLVLKTTGRVAAKALQRSERPLKDFPLYRRAQQARQQATQGEGGDAADTRKSAEELPQLIFSDTPPVGEPSSPPARRGAESDSIDVPFEVVEVDSGEQTAPDRTAVRGPQQPDAVPTADQPIVQRAQPVLPVNFYADEVHSEISNGRRVTVARGNVYLTQGDPESDLALELRSQEAVIFSEVLGEDGRPMPPKDTFAPGSVPLEEGRENVVGVYLEGDVIMARGERYMRGPDAYYDFTTDRAIMTDGVFRTVQEQRNIPIVFRFKEGRMLSAREMWFKDAKVSTSEFHTPTYHFGAKQVYLMDMTAYDEKGVRLSQRHWLTEMEHVTTNVRGVPIWYSPKISGDFEQGHTPLRKVQVGWSGEYGLDIESEWHLFRLLGLVKPEGYDAILHLDYKRGPTIGIEADYTRENYSGYAMLWGLLDQEQEDEFGRQAKNIDAPKNRGRILWRHKQFLPQDWQMQFELSYLCDRNYLRQFFPDEFYGGKEQETLAYAKKQRDNWAVDVLLQSRINRFLTQTESAPDVGARIIGQPLLNDTLTFFGEGRMGAKRWRAGSLTSAQKRQLGRMGMPIPDDSDWMFRGDIRAEVDMPLHLGPVNVVPFVGVRGDVWTDSPPDGSKDRIYGQAGVRVNTHIWRVYKGVHSRLFDVNEIKHIITPELALMVAGTDDVSPDNLYALSPDIEEHITRLSGGMAGIKQRWQTKRGEGANERIVDWMELDILAGAFDANENFAPPADGRWFLSRPEYSLGSNFVYLDYKWHISDSTTFLADVNYDIDDKQIGRTGIGLRVERTPRLSYFVGLRTINELSSAVGTFAMRYQINRKYEVAFIEQYDFDYDAGTNLKTAIEITRKFPRWYVGLVLAYDARYDDATILLNIYPEGIPEAQFRTGEYSILNRSERN